MKEKRAAKTKTRKRATRDRIVLEHLPLVRAIAVRTQEGLPVHIDLEDLINEGVIGLIDAAAKYEPGKRVVFPIYARHRIRGAMLDSLRRLDCASRDTRRRQREAKTAAQELTAQLQRAPTESELAAKLGMTQEHWRKIQIDIQEHKTLSTTMAQDSEEATMDLPGKEDARPDNICRQRQMEAALKSAMCVLPERYQVVVSLYYVEDLSMREIAGRLGVNESRISQIHKAALEKMAAKLESSGISSSTAF